LTRFTLCSRWGETEMFAAQSRFHLEKPDKEEQHAFPCPTILHNR
jgi:hypothetical protein